MYAEELLSALPLKKVIGPMPNLIKDIAIDSRIVEEKSLFVCIKGDTVDGHEYAQQAVNNGAIVIVTERELVLEGDVTQVIVQDTNRAIGLLAAKFFDYPSNELTIYGLPTNAKLKSAISANIIMASPTE